MLHIKMSEELILVVATHVLKIFFIKNKTSVKKNPIFLLVY